MLDLIAMAKALDASGPITALDALLDAMFAAAFGNAGDDEPIRAAVGDDVYMAQIDGGEYTGNWYDAKGLLNPDDYVAAQAIHHVRPNLTAAQINAEAAALRKGKKADKSAIAEMAQALIVCGGL